MGEFPRRLALLVNTFLSHEKRFPTPADKETFNTSPAISATLFKSSLFFIFVFKAQHVIFFFSLRSLPRRQTAPPPAVSLSFSTCLSSSSAIITLDRELPVVFFPQLAAAFHPFCCVVRTNRCNGGRVKWKCLGPLVPLVCWLLW